MSAPLGLIEGYYGEPWGEAARERVISWLAPRGYRFFIHAPKAEAFLRKRWREPFPRDVALRLEKLAAHCRNEGVRFGVGLSPYEAYLDFDGETRAALDRKIEEFDRIGIDVLAILFDDMRGDVPGLAETQSHILDWIAARTKAGQLITAPSYYTDDPVLDRLFGRRPDNYLEDLGRLLDPAIEVFWTGERVCSKEYSLTHLARVAGQLRRKPFLWDNYPVNDGPRMSQHLHLRAFTGRPAPIGAHLSGHAVNPALQSTLSLIPLLTLSESYASGERYVHSAAFQRAAGEVLGEELAAMVENDLALLQDTGLDRLGTDVTRLRERYSIYFHPGAEEIVRFLDGDYRFTGEMM